MAKERHKEVPASYLVLIKGGKILLQRRFNTGYMDGKYSLPAGHVDEGESFGKCIAREAKEEIGVDVDIKDLKFVNFNLIPYYEYILNVTNIEVTTFNL